MAKTKRHGYRVCPCWMARCKTWKVHKDWGRLRGVNRIIHSVLFNQKCEVVHKCNNLTHNGEEEKMWVCTLLLAFSAPCWKSSTMEFEIAWDDNTHSTGASVMGYRNRVSADMCVLCVLVKNDSKWALQPCHSNLILHAIWHGGETPPLEWTQLERNSNRMW